MIARRPEALLVVAILIFAGIAARRWQSVEARTDAGEDLLKGPAAISAFNETMLDDAAGNVTSRDPFRLSRTPPLVPFASRLAQGNTPPAPPFRPVLSLKGIVGGPPWQAIIDGIPGQPPGTVVRSGSSFDRLQVRDVMRDTVIVQLPDTVLVLTLKGVR